MHGTILHSLRAQPLRFSPAATGSQADGCHHPRMRRAAVLLDGAEQHLDLLRTQVGEFALLELEHLHLGQRVGVVDLPELLQDVEH
ncbi:hypothetical protein D3C80_1173520 [compost metagenome]